LYLVVNKTVKIADMTQKIIICKILKLLTSVIECALHSPSIDRFLSQFSMWLANNCCALRHYSSIELNLYKYS